MGKGALGGLARVPSSRQGMGLGKRDFQASASASCPVKLLCVLRQRLRVSELWDPAGQKAQG